MENRLSKYLVITDIDDTLMPHGGEIPKRNLEAIKRFTNEGGKFTFATGRSHYHCTELYKTLGICVPTAQNNGAYIYDCRSGVLSQKSYLPKTMKAYIHKACAVFPDMAVGLSLEEGFVYVSSEQSLLCQSNNIATRVSHDIDGIDQNWFKVLFVREEADMSELHRWLDENPLEGTYHINSSAVFCELMKTGVDKGEGIRKLAHATGVRMENTFAIGDFYNDIDMLKAAGTSVAVGDGAKEIIEMCDLVVGPCKDGAVADLIEYIERL